MSLQSPIDATESENYVLELLNVTKIFPGVKALDDVSLRLKKGEVHALVGENGAGKSTLINIISGVYLPDEGIVRVAGTEEQMTDPKHAFEKGISVVHQERNLIPTFTVAENIFFDQIIGKSFQTIDHKGIHEKAERLLARVKLNISPTADVEDLSSAQKQMIEIARALSMNARILLLDEPTASISQKEADLLMDTIRDLSAHGVSILYVSHKLEEIFAIANTVTVIRDGKNIGDSLPISALNRERLIEMMVGRSQSRETFPIRKTSREEIILKAVEIQSKECNTKNSFELRKGEILGWYGLVGSGRTELAREVIGIDPVKKGEVIVKGKKVKIRSADEAFKKHNIYYISENRKEEGLFLQHKICTNISIVALDKIKSKSGLLSYQKEKQLAEEYKAKLSIKTKSILSTVASLSGGNQQKVCIAKGLVTQPEIIIIDEPTVGIDVNTKAEIHKLIYNLAIEGMSIILISSDLPELILLADRIAVFRDGMICGELENQKEYEQMSNQIMTSILLQKTAN